MVWYRCKKIIDDNKIRKEKLKEQAKNDAIVECEFCHNKFKYGDHPSNNKNNHNFCCDEHKNLYIASFAKNKTKECVCVDCGCIVIVDKHVSPNHVRCNACSIKYKKDRPYRLYKLRKTHKKQKIQRFCLVCGKELTNYQKRFCSNKCNLTYRYNSYINRYNDYINRWKNGLENGMKGKTSLSSYIRKYIWINNQIML